MEASASSSWRLDVDLELSNRVVLVTGASSALGLSLTERLLRCHTPVHVVLLVPTREAEEAKRFTDPLSPLSVEPESSSPEPSARERVERALREGPELALATKLRFKGDRSLLLTHVSIIEVDLCAAPLMVPPSCESLVRGVEVVLHVALTSCLAKPLDSALGLNAKGTLSLIGLSARLMTRLTAFVLVSNAYVSPTPRTWRSAVPLEERLIPLGVSAESVLVDPLGKMAQSLLKHYASPAALSLAVTEHLASSLAERVHVPLAIVRAPMLAPARLYPYPGWCTRGLALGSPLCALIMEVARGRIQCVPASASALIHAVPVDACAEQIVLVAASTRHDSTWTQPSLHYSSSNPHSPSTPSARADAAKAARSVVALAESTVPTRALVLKRSVHVPPLAPPPVPLKSLSNSTPNSAPYVAPRWYHAGEGCATLRWSVVAEALSAFWQRHPLRDSVHVGGLYLVPTRAHFERDYLLRFWLPARLGSLTADSATAARTHSELSALRGLIKRLRPFLRSEWPLQRVTLSQIGRTLTPNNSDLSPSHAQGVDWTEYLFIICHGLRVHVFAEPVPAHLDASELRTLSQGAHDVLSEGAAPRGLVGDLRFLLQSSYHTPQRLATRSEQLSVRSAVLSSPSVREAMRSEISKRGGTPEAASAVDALVKDALEEMSAALDVAQLRVFGFVFRKLWQTLYQSVSVNTRGLERVATLLRDGAVVVYLPSHRSYMDFLVLSYVLFARHLPLPHIAAGNDFLGLSAAVHVLRSGGAFFMRRSLGSDALYASLLNEYVQQLLGHGCSLEFFLEGTRARSGKTLRPKLGLLRTVLDAWRSRRVRALHFVPVHINYERLVEAEMYPRELLGLPKRKESLKALFDARSVWSERYGRIAIELGEPISLEASEWSTWNALDLNTYKTRVGALGERVVHSINSLSVWSALTLVSSLLLSHRGGVSRSVLVDSVSWLRSELLRRNVGRDDWLRSESSSALVALALSQLTRVVSEVSGQSPRVVPDSDPESVLVLASYRNKLLHVFAHEGYALLSLSARGGASARALIEDDVRFLDLLFRRDVIDREDPLSPPDTAATLSSLRDAGALILSPHVDTLSVQSSSRHTFFCLELVWPFIEAYYFAALFMAVAPGVYPKLELTATLSSLQRSLSTLHSQHRTYATEALSKETLTHALQSIRALALNPKAAYALAERLAPMRRSGAATFAEDAALMRSWQPLESTQGVSAKL